ncbi:RlpA-like double-psi beta-barrel domain-containing protein [Deinococcus sp.]|uniref:septal ring lytic transglycosylase RlpA family protein n=1 Tax=Deinococcus sp. TaxID=47478 RepID=UPI0025BFA012|nr:RlpA-like double-psi beta-barrel domain-containing protein [Deinococcus sp.]
MSVSRRVWAVLAAAALAAGPGAAQAGPYRVQAGDTLWQIARAHGVSVQKLLDMNGRTGGALRPGEVLTVPGGNAATQASVRAPAMPPAAGQRGQAVYYGGRRDGRTVMTAAHLSLPLGTWVRVTHERTGRSVNVLINDRGPFGVPSRIIDLSRNAAAALGILSEGTAPVRLDRVR